MKKKSTLVMVAVTLALCTQELIRSTSSGSDALKHVVVYYEPGRFAGWPANAGAWNWGDEILVGFHKAYFQDHEDGHSIDRDRPGGPVQARSLDGGQTWTVEERSGLTGEDALPCRGGINFTHPDLAMAINRSYLQISYNRGNTWSQSCSLPDFGLKADLTSRTDYLVKDQDTCLIFLSARERSAQTEESLQDRAFCARMKEGGKTMEFLSWMTGEPLAVRSVMPSTVRISKTDLLSVMRRRLDLNPEFRNDLNWLDAYRSRDNGKSWEFASRLAYTDTILRNGNPPSLVRLADGRVVATYGYRGAPFGIRARISRDNGETWGEEIILREDGRSYDLGYPRSVVREDGKIVTIYYFATAEHYEQHIAATIWDPNRF